YLRARQAFCGCARRNAFGDALGIDRKRSRAGVNVCEQSTDGNRWRAALCAVKDSGTEMHSAHTLGSGRTWRARLKSVAARSVEWSAPRCHPVRPLSLD